MGFVGLLAVDLVTCEAPASPGSPRPSRDLTQSYLSNY